ncbi:Nudix hydrolase 20, chloroplastic, variant 2 [Stylosanthes scabra]|uniref:Nudix hydrolase 20, chloroplastic, variant 2 n=1 Tax=Stylosanthes scabra TaxID=79078 RepID=A0ABU6YKK0_9FABA|nr:Nudix hydrolase 20, chloroplastic, variant 2 [Stylosanthes scabra]
MHTTLVISKLLKKMGWCLCKCRPSLSTFSSLLYSKTSSLPFPSTFLPSSSSTTTTPSIKSNIFSSSISSFASSSAVATGTFTWEDVFRISQSAEEEEDNNSSYLHGYFHKVQLCNRGSGKQSEFLPFVIEDQTVGFIHSGFVEHFKSFSDVFINIKDNSNGGSIGECVSLNPMLKTAEERTSAVAYVIKCLGEEHIPGIRNELYPVVSSFGSRVLFSLERAAAPYFGIKAYGIHMNGYVEIDGQKHLWIGKRSNTKQTYPGMLDHLVAGGLPHGIDCKENVVKECEEEAGIPRSISSSRSQVRINEEGCVACDRHRKTVSHSHTWPRHNDIFGTMYGCVRPTTANVKLCRISMHGHDAMTSLIHVADPSWWEKGLVKYTLLRSNFSTLLVSQG